MALTISKEELLGIDKVEAPQIMENATQTAGEIATGLDNWIMLLEKINELLRNPFVQIIVKSFMQKFGINIDLGLIAQTQAQTTQQQNFFNFDIKTILENAKAIAGDKTINQLLDEYGDTKIKDIIEAIENVFCFKA